MNLASSLPGHSLGLRADHQLVPANPTPSACPTFDPGQAASGLPAIAIGQRSCVGPTNSARPDSELFAVTDRLPTVRQHESEPETEDGEGPWQVVTRRRSGNKQQSCRSNARLNHGGRSESASAHQFLANGSAGCEGQAQRLHESSKDPVSLSPMTSGWCWPLCVKSFARLAEVSWGFFDSCHATCRERALPIITKDDFRRFHQMMSKGPQAIRTIGEAVFLIRPFKVLLCDNQLLPSVILLSLVLERTVPGFVNMIGQRFASGLVGVDRKHSDLFTAITELLAQFCREEERSLDSLGWQKLSMRNRCNLFSAVAFCFKSEKKIDLIHSLHRQVSWSCLETYYYNTLESLSGKGANRNQFAQLRNLKAGIHAVFAWLEGNYFVISKSGERRSLILTYASVIESLIKVMDSLDMQRNDLLFGVWQAVAQWSFRFRAQLSNHLGFDRTIVLLNGILNFIQCWPRLERLAFELRLTLLGLVLLMCEELLFRRDYNLFSRTWRQHQHMLDSLLARCNEFMGRYEPPFIVDDEADRDRRMNEARLNLLLRECKFNRLSCEGMHPDRQKIRDNLQKCCTAFYRGWALSTHHREVGIIELAKWYFLAGQHDTGLSSLMGVPFEQFKLSGKKAELLVREGAYRAAVDEFHHTKALMSKSGEIDQRTLDEIDNRLAMAQLKWYQTEDDTDHLVEAYRLSVDLLGRCDSRDRELYEGGLSHIVNAMKASGLRFVDYVGPTSVLGYLVKDGCGIKSWQHFANLLYIRHKIGFTDPAIGSNLTAGIARKDGHYLELGKKS